MSKKKKSQKPKNNGPKVNDALDASLEQNDEIEVVEPETTVSEQKVQPQKEKNKNDNKKANKKNPKEKGKLKRKVKESVAEIKNVVWPSFGDVVRKTGVVLAVVVVFAVIIFGIDLGLGELVKLLR